MMHIDQEWLIFRQRHMPNDIYKHLAKSVAVRFEHKGCEIVTDKPLDGDCMAALTEAVRGYFGHPVRIDVCVQDP